MSRRHSRSGQITVSKSAGKLARLRDKALRQQCRIKHSTLLSCQRHEARMAWWQRAFRAPMTRLNWVYSSSAALWGALLSFLGLTAKPSLGISHRHGDISRTRNKQQRSRGLMHEGLEARQLLAYYITAPIMTDNVINDSERTVAAVSGTTDSTETQVALTISDGSNTVFVTAPVVGNAWSVSNLDVSGLSDTGGPGQPADLTVTAFNLASPGTGADVEYIGKDTVAPVISLNPIATDGIINISESAAVTVSGGVPLPVPFWAPSPDVKIIFTSGSFTATRTVNSAFGGFSSNSAPVDLSGLPDGAIVTIEAQIKDAAGNVGSVTRTAVTDFSAPAAPSITTPSVNQQFNNANGGTVNVSGTGALPNGTVRISAQGTTGTVAPVDITASPAGSFNTSINLLTLPDGNITIFVSTVDDAGNLGTSQRVVVLDKIAPTLTLNPLSQINAGNVGAYPIGGTTDNPVGAIVNIKVSDGVNPDVNGSATVVAGGLYATTLNVGSLSNTSVALPAITVTVSNSDAAGNTQSAMRTTTKDSSAPAPLITTPISGDGYINALEAGTLVISGTSADPSTQIGLTVPTGATVSSSNPVMPNADGTFSFTVNMAGATDGAVTFLVSQTDSFGNLGTNSATATLDRLLPGIVSSPINASVNPFGTDTPLALNATTKDTTIKFSGTAPAVGLPANSNGKVTVYAKLLPSGTPVEVGSATTTGTGHSWTLTTSPLAEGTYTFTATLKDLAGNESAPVTWGNARIDTTAPDLAITGNNFGSVINFNEALNAEIHGTFADAVSISVAFHGGAQSVTAAASLDTPTPGEWTANSLNLSSLPDGAIMVIVTATDAAGNANTATASFLKDTVASTPAISTPITTDNVLNISESANFTIQGAGAEPGQLVTLTIKELANPGNIYTPAAVTALASGGFVFSGLDLPASFDSLETMLTATVTTTDVNGNQSSSSVNFGLDTKAPGPLSKAHNSLSPVGWSSITSDSWGANGINFAEQSGVRISGTGAEPNSTVTISYDDSGANSSLTPPVVQLVTSNAAGEFVTPAVSLSGLNDGTLTITITTTDAAGNAVSIAPTVFKDSAAPFVFIDPISGGMINASEAGAVIVTGLQNDASSMVVTLTDRAGTVVTMSPSIGVGSFGTGPVNIGTGANTLLDGTITARVIATDATGNQTSLTKDFIKDTVKPALTIATPAPAAQLNATQAAGVLVAGTVSEANTQVVVTFSDGVHAPISKIATTTGNNFTLAGNLANLSGLDDGSISISVTSTDAAGNIGTEGISVTKDSTAPIVIITNTTLNPIMGDGRIGAAEVSAVVISGTVSDSLSLPAGTVVNIKFSDGVVAHDVSTTALTDAIGAFTLVGSPVNLAGLNDGTITLTATVDDAAGNIATATTTIMKDVSPPVLVLNTIAGDDVINKTEDIVISGTGADANQGVQISIGGFGPQTVYADSSGEFTYKLTPTQKSSLAQGTLTVTASSSDLAGNAGSKTRSVVLDTFVPTISLSLAGMNATVPVNAAEAAVITFTGTVFDDTPNNGALTGQTVTLILDDVGAATTSPVTLTGLVTFTSPSTYSFTTTAASIASLNNGTINVTSATVTDKAGNVSTNYVANTLNFQLDKVAPPAPVITGAGVTSTLPASLANNSITNHNTPNIFGSLANNGTSGDAWAINVGATIDLFLDGSATKLNTTPITVGAGGNWSFSLISPLADGSHVFTAKATDAAGNVGAVSSTFTLQIDTIAPNLTITSPIAGDDKINFVEQGSVTIAGKGADPGRPVTITLGGPATVPAPQTVIADSNGDFSAVFDVTGMADGGVPITMTVNATSSDVAGNNGNAPQKTVQKETAPPEPMLNLVADNDEVNLAEQTAGVWVTGSGAEKNMPVVVTFDDGIHTPVVVAAIADDFGNFTTNLPSLLANLSSLNDGSITVSVTSSDAFQNVGTVSRVITKDAVKPAIAITAPISVDGLVNSAEAADFSFYVTGKDAASDVSYTLSDGTHTTAAQLSAASPGGLISVGNLTSLFPALVDGTITIVVSNTDAAGNTGSDSKTFTLDRVKPAIAITNPLSIAGDGLINVNEAGAVTVNGTGAHPGGTVKVTFSDTTLPTAVIVEETTTADDSGNYSVTANVSGLHQGSIAIKASSKDPAGNEGTTTASATLDTVIAQITIDNPVAGDNIINGVEAVGVLVKGSNGEPGQNVVVKFDDGQGHVVTRTVVAQAPSGTWSLLGNEAGLLGLSDTTNLIITASTADLAGNASSSAPKIVQLHKTAPPLTINTISGDGNVSNAEKTSVAISGGGAEAGKTVTITLTDANLNVRTLTDTATASGTFAKTFDLTSTTANPFVDGTISVQVQSADFAGNVGNATRTFVLDTLAPVTPGVPAVASDSGPLPGELTNDGITNDNTLKVTGSVPGSGGSASTNTPVTTIEILNGTTLLGTATIGTGSVLSGGNGIDIGKYSYSTAAVEDGVYNFRVRAKDAAGNVSGLSSNNLKKITVDTVVPTIDIQDVIAGDDYINAAESAGTVTITGMTNNSSSTVNVVVLDSDGHSISKSVVADASGSFSISLVSADYTTLHDGNLTIIGQTTDAAGNTGSDTEIVKLDRSAPNVSITSHSNGQAVGDSTTVTGVVEPNRSVTVTLGGASTTVTATVTGAYAATLSLAAIADGPVTLMVTSKDLANNEGSATRSLTKDTQIGTPSIDANIAGNDVVSAAEQTAVAVSGTGAEPNRPVTVTFTSGAVTMNVVGAADGSGVYSLNSPADLHTLPDGNVTVTVKTTDLAGNFATASRIILKDTTGPVVTTSVMTVNLGGATVLQSSRLSSVDAVSPASAVMYTVTTLPLVGRVALASNPSISIGTFSQAQVDAGEIVYVSLGTTTTTTDAFSFQVRDAEGNMSTGTMNLSVIAVDLPNVTSVKINDGAAQRSKVKTIEITFDQVVNGTNAANAIMVQKRSDAVGGGPSAAVSGVIVNSVIVGSGATAHTVVTLTFAPSSSLVDVTGSLVDGNYQVAINANMVTSNTGGFRLDGNNDGVAGDNFVFGNKATDLLYRKFGDYDGGILATGQAYIDSLDATAFLSSYNNPAAYNEIFDIDGDGMVELLDATTFLANYQTQRDLNGFTP